MISVIIHTYNEEQNIERALKSIDFADEIVLVDMGSTDKTVKIAKKYGAKICFHPYTGYVEPARNFGISKAKNDWIFILDADEIVQKNLSKFLTDQINTEGFDYYRIPRKNIIFGKWIKHGGWWPDFQIRFFKKGHVDWLDKLHSVPITYGRGCDIEVAEELSIIHYNYQSIHQFLKRLDRYTSFNAKELISDNYKFSITDLFEKPSKEFIRRLLVWEGYKDGIHGLVLSFLQGFSELIIYIKIWEINGFAKQDIKIKDIDKNVNKLYQEQKYHITEKIISTERSIFRSIHHRIKRILSKYV